MHHVSIALTINFVRPTYLQSMQEGNGRFVFNSQTVSTGRDMTSSLKEGGKVLNRSSLSSLSAETLN
jgi:hypothetical protein